jgi:hypothetical protein
MQIFKLFTKNLAKYLNLGYSLYRESAIITLEDESE